MVEEFTKDAIMGGKIIIKQPSKGYRVGIDAILLASLVEANDGDKVLDMGAGVGSISLCLLKRLPLLNVTSIEKNTVYFNTSKENKDINTFAQHYTPILFDIVDYKNSSNVHKELKEAFFDVIVSNPPYYCADSNNISPSPLKKVANTESSAKLQDFINAAYYFLKHQGSLYMIHNSNRLSEIVNLATSNKWGGITVYPIYSFVNSKALRVIIKMQKLSKAETIIENPIIVHNQDKSYTKTIKLIIEEGLSYKEAKL